MTNHRVTILKEIARLYPDLIDTLNGPAGIRGTGDSDGLMPTTYTPTVREYERLVKAMRDDRHEPLLDGKLSVRAAWWHLEHWHHRAERVIRHQPIQTNGKRGRKLTVLNSDGTPATKPTIAWLRDPKASEAKADRPSNGSPSTGGSAPSRCCRRPSSSRTRSQRDHEALHAAARCQADPLPFKRPIAAGLRRLHRAG
jgi:hypothetical protein